MSAYRSLSYVKHCKSGLGHSSLCFCEWIMDIFYHFNEYLVSIWSYFLLFRFGHNRKASRAKCCPCHRCSGHCGGHPSLVEDHRDLPRLAAVLWDPRARLPPGNARFVLPQDWIMLVKLWVQKGYIIVFLTASAKCWYRGGLLSRNTDPRTAEKVST